MAASGFASWESSTQHCRPAPDGVTISVHASRRHSRCSSGNRSGRSPSTRNSAAGAMGTVYRGVYTKTGQQRRHQDHAARPGAGKRQRRRPLRARGRHPQAVQSSQHRPALRHRQVPRHALLRHGVHRRRVARPHHGPPRPADLGRGRRSGHATLRRPAARPRGRRHPPRPEAVQPHDPQDGKTLKLTDFGIAKDTGRHRAHPRQLHRRHRRLHVARSSAAANAT